MARCQVCGGKRTEFIPITSLPPKREVGTDGEKVEPEDKRQQPVVKRRALSTRGKTL